MFDRLARFWSTAIIVLASWISAQSGHAEEPIRLRILTYNINHGEGIDSRIDLNRITSVIQHAQPDLVALQEVDRGMARTGRLDQARLLASRLGMEYVFGENFEFLGGSFGNAVLSRVPITEHRNHLLPSPAGGEPRGALSATLSLADDGSTFRIISTQFDHRQDDRNRLAAADWLAGLADNPDAPPAILAGDLNAIPTSPTVRRLSTRWTPASPEVMPTVPANAPRAAFDHVFVAPADRWSIVEVRVLPDSEASDHRPILIVLDWLPQTAEPPTNP
ncbi:endonuclease/exonuclease/phosphatase family protein [Tautonia rosea]|uniref:endonuclease/exonuclease/phosphatase family protein n=1 Tax=Tautonia rosea TaxID=2728037 RepID=UPI00147646AC|nr:endonuclease/exonuclease/phosphatase family protein [Tautonia rosea]